MMVMNGVDEASRMRTAGLLVREVDVNNAARRCCASLIGQMRYILVDILDSVRGHESAVINVDRTEIFNASSHHQI
jgi:hypothetical protein